MPPNGKATGAKAVWRDVPLIGIKALLTVLADLGVLALHRGLVVGAVQTSVISSSAKERLLLQSRADSSWILTLELAATGLLDRSDYSE